MLFSTVYRNYRKGMTWYGDYFENFASSRSLTYAGSPENHIYYRLLKIKPSGGLTEQQ